MRVEPVEIFADTTNAAVMRHPGRHFPGMLIQGDTLHSFCCMADDACSGLDRSSEAYKNATSLETGFGRTSMTTKPFWMSTACLCRSATEAPLLRNTHDLTCRPPAPH